MSVSFKACLLLDVAYIPKKSGADLKIASFKTVQFRESRILKPLCRRVGAVNLKNQREEKKSDRWI